MATWSTYATPNTGAATIASIICVRADTFVAVGTAGTVLTSDDGGQTWTSRTAAEANSWNDIAYDGTTLVAVSFDGANRVMVSTDDGHTWTSKSAISAANWASVTYASFLGMFIATGPAVAIGGVMYSTDSGNSWTSATASSAAAWSVAASPSLVLAATGSGLTMTSPDGINWTAGSTAATFGQASGESVVYSAAAGGFVLFGRDTGTVRAKACFTTDGSSFTYATASPLDGYQTFRAFVPAESYGGFISGLLAISPGNTTSFVMLSDDGGATWTDEDTGFSGRWRPGSWDEDTSTVVFWDLLKTNTMLVGVAASVSAITPTFGTKNGNTVCTITGVGLSGVTSVTFGGAAAVSVVATATSITCITPSHAVGLVDVVVTGVGTLTDAFTFVSVDRVTPSRGSVAGATAVTITGFGFAAATSVLFGGTAATDVVVVSNTEITAVVPAHASGDVDVEVVGVDTGTSLYRYTLSVPQTLGKGPLLPPIPTRRGA